MGQFVERDVEYQRKALRTLGINLNWDLIARRDETMKMITQESGATAVRFPVKKPEVANVNALPATGSALTTTAMDQVAVDITLHEYGEGIVEVPAGSTMRSVTPALMDAVESISQRAALSINALCALQAVKAIAGSTGAGNYTHPALNGGVATDVHTAKLVYLGTGATTKATRVTVADTEILTADVVRRAYAVLKNRKVKPFAFGENGAPLYAAFCNSYCLKDLKGSTSATDFTPLMANIDNGVQIKTGGVGVFEGFIFFEVDDDYSVNSGAGAGGINLYNNLFCGANFVGKGFMQTSDLPKTDDGVEVMDLFESVQIRLVPSYDSHARHKRVVWYGYLDYGIIDPLCAIRWETASTLG